MGKARREASADLREEQIRKLLVRYSVPGIIAMTSSSLYNMIDSIFIGQGVGALAISGLALTFPLMNLSAAFGSLVGVGASAHISMLLGRRDVPSATRVLGNVVTLNLLIGCLFALVTLWYLDPILYFFGASPQTIGYAREYAQVILLGNIITHMYIGLNAVLRASGHPRESMKATINTVVFNILLNPLFIYGLDWGIRGAAVATILSQLISLVWQVRILSRKEELLHFRSGSYRLRKRIAGKIFAIGLSPFIMNIAACLVVIFVTKGLKEYGGDLMIGAYGIVNRMSFIFIMIVMGLNQGMQPIAGYNYGAGQYDRTLKVLRLTLLGATLVTTTGFIIGEFLPHHAVRLFTSDEEMTRLAVTGMRIVFAFAPFIGFQMVTSNFLQSTGRASKAIFLSVSRQLLFLLPALLLLPQLFGVATPWDKAWGVWWAIPLSDLLAAFVAGLLLRSELRRFGRRQRHNKDNRWHDASTADRYIE